MRFVHVSLGKLELYFPYKSVTLKSSMDGKSVKRKCVASVKNSVKCLTK